MPAKTIFVDTVADSAQVVTSILDDFDKAPKTYAIAVDLEGRDIGPAEGILAIVTVGTPDGTVFLFDVAAMKEAAFAAGLLKVLLEHPQLPKLWYDCRGDTAELFKYDVHPQMVVDLQVGAVMKIVPMGRFIIGLAKTLVELRLVSAKDNAIKEAGLKLFAPERGGSYDVWFTRPLTEAMTAYASVDVKHLFAAREILRPYEAHSLRVAQKRTVASYKPGFQQGRHMAHKDF